MDKIGEGKTYMAEDRVVVREEIFQNEEAPVIVGESNAIGSVRRKIEKVARTNATVLIRGESGTGKELVAKSIHLQSSRWEERFVKVNGAALPNELVESELFGYVKGAFTGATQHRKGKFEKAERGTILFDEIGSLNITLQSKFLQILEEKKLTRLGSVDERHVDVRILAATNADLEKQIADNRFREDLFYRLNVISITVPPLRERKEDISLLTDYFMSKYCNSLQKPRVDIDDTVWAHFQQYHWPGNVRELENVIKRIIVLQKPDVVCRDLKIEEIETEHGNNGKGEDADIYGIWDDKKIEYLLKGKEDISLKTLRQEYVAEAEKRSISKALHLTNWNRKKASELLKVSYKTVLNKIEELDLINYDFPE